MRFLVRRDKAGRFRFGALQGEAARRLCAAHGVPLPQGDPDSVVVIAGGRALERSDAALAIAARLPFPWPVFGVFRIVPRAVRDWAYRAIARNRYRWFGRQESCLLPTPELRARFID